MATKRRLDDAEQKEIEVASGRRRHRPSPFDVPVASKPSFLSQLIANIQEEGRELIAEQPPHWVINEASMTTMRLNEPLIPSPQLQARPETPVDFLGDGFEDAVEDTNADRPCVEPEADELDEDLEEFLLEQENILAYSDANEKFELEIAASDRWWDDEANSCDVVDTPGPSCGGRSSTLPPELSQPQSSFDPFTMSQEIPGLDTFDETFDHEPETEASAVHASSVPNPAATESQEKSPATTASATVAVAVSGSKATENPNSSFFGLSMQVKSLFTQLRGIPDLYDWQKQCLAMEAECKDHNLIYSLPTSGGKTLVAEILVLRTLLLAQKHAIFILPFVSIVEEKAAGFQPFAEALKFHVEIYAGHKGKVPPVIRRDKRASVFVATIEKASSLINNLIEEKKLDNVGMVVVDELHMIGSGSRGALLEIVLAKVKAVCPEIKIVGMSATLKNMHEMAAFLDAKLYENNFRPVSLKEFVKVGKEVYSVADFCEKKEPTRKVESANAGDPEALGMLVQEVIPANSCLVFCPSKQACQNVAAMLASVFKTMTPPADLAAKRQRLLDDLKLEAAGLCSTMKRAIPTGIAYHHGGLTQAERLLIENAYGSGVLSVLACTSTLATGVNLPARRVIIRSPFMGSQPLTKAQYKQMAGRAGRAGIDSAGESYLLVQPRQVKDVVQMLEGPMDECKSHLLSDSGKLCRKAILSLVSSGMAVAVDNVFGFMAQTLAWQQQPEHVEEYVKETLDLLLKQQLLVDKGGVLGPSALGMAVYRSGFDSDLAAFYRQELRKIQDKLIMSCDLHLLYAITPADMMLEGEIDWMHYYRVVSKLSPKEVQVAEAVGVSEGELIKRATKDVSGKAAKVLSSSYDQIEKWIEYLSSTENACRRFYLTLMLYRVVFNEHSVWRVSEEFRVSRGFLQSLLQAAAVFASCIVSFCEELKQEFWGFAVLLPAFTKRLAFGVRTELVALMEIPGIKQARARQLFAAGFKTVQSLAHATPQELVLRVPHLHPRAAKQIVRGATEILKAQAEEMLDEAHMLLPTAVTTSS